jgi:hypothetical protein
MSEPPPPETPTAAARALILAFALALAFRCVDRFGPGTYTDSAACGIGAVGLTIVDFKLKWVLEKAGPGAAKTLNNVATDARWWIVTALVFLLVLTFSPFVEQHRWPFSTPEPVVSAPNQSLPSDTALIAKLRSENADLRKTQDKATAAESPAVSSAQSSFAESYNLTDEYTRQLRDEVSKALPFLPSHLSFLTADDPRARTLTYQLARGFGLAGVDTSGVQIGYQRRGDRNLNQNWF